MTLKAKFYYLTSPRKVRGFATAVMAVIGLLAVIAAILFTQDANAALISFSESIASSPAAGVVQLLKSLF